MLFDKISVKCSEHIVHCELHYLCIVLYPTFHCYCALHSFPSIKCGVRGQFIKHLKLEIAPPLGREMFLDRGSSESDYLVSR